MDRTDLATRQGYVRDFLRQTEPGAREVENVLGRIAYGGVS